MCCPACAATKLEQQVQEVAGLMLRKGLFMKTERMFKKPKPGKKRLVKWPKKLLPLHNDKVGRGDCAPYMKHMDNHAPCRRIAKLQSPLSLELELQHTHNGVLLA